MLPILGALILQAAYGAVDVLVVGWFGTTEGLSGVSTGSSIINLVTFVLTGLATGITVILGTCIGSGSTEKAGRVIGSAIFFFIAIGVVLTVLGLKERRRHLPSRLSGGQQQRVAIGRALITRPALILADEPTGNLDTQNTSEVIALLKEASHLYEQTIVMITHSQSIAQTADRILRVSDGVVTDFGRCREWCGIKKVDSLFSRIS